MTSTAPPLSHSSSRLTPPCESPFTRSVQPGRINWPLIFASVSVSFALVAGIFAWIATHPHKAAPPQSVSMVAVEPLAISPPAPPKAPMIAVTPAFHQTPREKKTDNVPLLEVNPPPLPPPASPQPKQQRSHPPAWVSPWQMPPEAKKPAGETYGTQVLFLNSQDSAAELARNDHKLMFVMHISGHFEDSCFT